MYLFLFRVNKLWWVPTQPSLITTQPPRLDRYFAQRLLLWMPCKLWKVTLYCPNEGCDKKPLTSAGIYSIVRQVVDIDSDYNLVAEYLECRCCARKVISWSPEIVKQLDTGHQVQFPVLLNYQYACDVRVIRLLGNRGLGNSSTQLQKKLTEENSEKWLQKSAQYLTDCKYFTNASKSGLTGGCNPEAHPLYYSVFFSCLSQCLFQWSKEDLDLLKTAKKSQLQIQGIADPSEAGIIEKITKRELALHCRRRTRGIVLQHYYNDL